MEVMTAVAVKGNSEKGKKRFLQDFQLVSRSWWMCGIGLVDLVWIRNTTSKIIQFLAPNSELFVSKVGFTTQKSVLFWDFQETQMSRQYTCPLMKKMTSWLRIVICPNLHFLFTPFTGDNS